MGSKIRRGEGDRIATITESEIASAGICRESSVHLPLFLAEGGDHLVLGFDGTHERFANPRTYELTSI